MHHCQAVPFVSRCVSRISARDGSIKTIFPNLTFSLGLFPCGMGNSGLLMLPAFLESVGGGVAAMGRAQIFGVAGVSSFPNWRCCVMTKGKNLATALKW